MIFLEIRANGEIERLRRVQSSEVEGIQAQLRYAQLRVQSLEQELKSVKQELEQKVRKNDEFVVFVFFVRQIFILYLEKRKY